MATMTVKYGETVNLTANSFTKTICKFTNWITADGTTYTDTAEISNLTATDGEEIVLTAQWMMYGDIDLNGKVNVRDITTLQLYLVNRATLTDQQKEAANVNGDTRLNVRDVTTIQMYLAKQITNFPVCE